MFIQKSFRLLFKINFTWNKFKLILLSLLSIFLSTRYRHVIWDFILSTSLASRCMHGSYNLHSEAELIVVFFSLLS